MSKTIVIKELIEFLESKGVNQIETSGVLSDAEENALEERANNTAAELEENIGSEHNTLDVDTQGSDTGGDLDRTDELIEANIDNAFEQDTDVVVSVETVHTNERPLSPTVEMVSPTIQQVVGLTEWQNEMQAKMNELVQEINTIKQAFDIKIKQTVDSVSTVNSEGRYNTLLQDYLSSGG